jgi:cyanophycinase
VVKALRRIVQVVVAAIAGLAVAGCHVTGPVTGEAKPTGLSGRLILIGGGLDDDNRPVYQRFIELARATAPGGESPRIVIATAASGDEEAGAVGKTESIRAYAADAQIDVIRRGTSTAETVALVDACNAMFFTGGDQKRIVDRYRPEGLDTPEAEAMRRLLARGGVIAGTSAGDAMMSDPMFLTGRSAEALGIRSTRQRAAEDDDPDEKRPLPPLGPQIGTGMGFLPWAIADSHFFERNRFGRLVAALEASGKRLGIGVGEDAGVEVDLATGELIGLSVADSLLVDAAALTRDGLSRRNVRAMVVRQGTRVRLTELSQPGSVLRRPAGEPEAVRVVEPGQNRQLASWRFFLQAQTAGRPVQTLRLDGYQQSAWPDGRGWSVVEIAPLEASGLEPRAAATR